MATRPYYRPLEKTVGCKTVESWQFEWHGGFAVSQKQKNVFALHEAIHLAEPEAKILEISSKSLQPLGALYVSLCRTGKLEETMSSREAFLSLH